MGRKREEEEENKRRTRRRQKEQMEQTVFQLRHFELQVRLCNKSGINSKRAVISHGRKSGARGVLGLV